MQTSTAKPHPLPLERLLALAYRRRWRGVHLARRCWIALGGRTALRHRNRFGALFDLTVYDYIDQIVLTQGYYESEVLEALLPHTGPGTILWDIGANFGLHAVTLKHLAPETEVHAFEPSVVSAARLVRHARLNSVDVTLWPFALGAEAAYSKLHIVADGNPGMTTLFPWSRATYGEHQPVRVERADDLIAGAGAPPPTVIKLDVEGGELAALTGLGRYLNEPNLRAIVFEAGTELVAAPALDPIGALLLASGFALRPLFRQEHTAHALGNFCAFRR